jgi:hypothetical protein
VANIDQDDVQWLLDHLTDFLSRSTHIHRPESGFDLHSVFVNAYQRGFMLILYIGASLSTLTFLFAFALMPHLELSSRDEEKLKTESEVYDQPLRLKKEAVEVSVWLEERVSDQRDDVE